MKCKLVQCRFPADPFSVEGFCRACRAKAGVQERLQRTADHLQRCGISPSSVPKLPSLGNSPSQRCLSASGPSIHRSGLMPVCRVCEIRHLENQCQHRLPPCQFCRQRHVSMASNFKEASCLANLLYQDSFAKKGYDRQSWKLCWRAKHGPRLDDCFPTISRVLSQPEILFTICMSCHQRIDILQQGCLAACIDHFFGYHQA